jgi:hypothetical protein
VAAVLALCATIAVLSTLMNRPDADDITFFPRAVAQLAQLGSPILTADVTSDVQGLPGASMGYLLTSYEFLVALVARGLGLDPLAVYHNAAGALGSALVPAVYYLLLRRLGLAPLLALAGVCGTVAFLLLDGNDHRSMGNLAFVRLWQGKAVLLILLPPYILTHTLAFLSAGGRRAWLCVVLAGVGATGLSTIGGFFAPAVIVTAMLAVGGGLLVTRQAAARPLLRRGALLAAGCVWPLLLLGVTLLAPVPGAYSPGDATRAAVGRHAQAFSLAPPATGWFANLLLPAGGPVRALWSLLLVAAAPFLSLPRKQAILVASSVPVLLVLVANPVSGGLLYAAVPGVFWRFAYLLPVPLCAGLLVVAVAQAFSVGPARTRVVRAGVAAAFAVVFAATVTLTTVSPGNMGFSWKSPSAWKLDAATVAALDPWLPQLAGRRVLTDEPAAVALCLADPSARALCHRPQVTLLSFAVDGRLEDGLARVRAQRVVAGASDEAGDVAAFAHVSHDADAILARTGAAPLVRSALAREDAAWREAGSDAGFTLFLREGPL